MNTTATRKRSERRPAGLRERDSTNQVRRVTEGRPVKRSSFMGGV